MIASDRVQKEDLAELLKRVEAAEGADVRLDGDIAVALGLFQPIKARHERVFGNSWHTKLTGSPTYMAPAFTTSLDAALALCERVLPDGWNWDIGSDFDGLGKFYSGQAWSGRYDTYGQPCVSRTSPALALLAALLKALIAKEQS